MAATTGQLGLVTPTQGTLSGTWGDTVNNGITEYTNIAIAATLTLTNDGAVTLANTTGDASASNITSTLTGAGTVTAQFAIVRVTGTLTTAKVVTAPSYSKTYTVVNAATGGIVTFKASGQTGVSIAVGESAFVYYNGTDYVKVSTSTSGTGDVVGPSSATANGVALFDGTTGKLIKDSAASDGLIYGLTVGRGGGAVSTNTAVGAGAIAATATGIRNVAVGATALPAVTSGNNNVAVGFQAGNGITTASENIAVGSFTLNANTTGGNNVAIGMQALVSNTTASGNTAVGYQSLYTNTTAARNIALGYQAGYSNTGSSNLFIGYQAGFTNTTGTGNSFVGAMDSNNWPAGYYNTTGADNSAFGGGALRANTTGSSNTAVGTDSLHLNTTASNNTAVGYQAGYTNSTGIQNVFIGNQAGYFATGRDNTFVGNGAGGAVTTGTNNTIIGQYDGNGGGLDIRTASNYIVLSDGDGNPRMYSDGSGVLYDQNGKLRAIPQSGSSKTTSYTLATTDVGEFIEVGSGGSITIPDATFATGDVVSIFNNTSSTVTITCSITTAYKAGTDADQASVTLQTRGVATVLFISSTVCVISGNLA